MPGKDSKKGVRSPGPGSDAPAFFATPADFRGWLERNHTAAKELLVGFHKKGSGSPSITWPESVDQALCFGWIDGVRRSLGDASYTIRFTPRKPGSTWSAINIARVKELTSAGLMHPAGVTAFEARQAHKSAIYSYEQRHAAQFDAAAERQFRANQRAWEFFQQQPPGYRRLCTYFVVNAKQDATRVRRLARLIADSEAGRRIKELSR
ncbi:MAG TPA: YdeI/OmpD-associated family protein [Bryobacteraceae bacterium]|nr:YdeI/OmpD-associated family protein [Bryobacteraceae bacterium]